MVVMCCERAKPFHFGFLELNMCTNEYILIQNNLVGHCVVVRASFFQLPCNDRHWSRQSRFQSIVNMYVCFSVLVRFCWYICFWSLILLANCVFSRYTNTDDRHHKCLFGICGPLQFWPVLLYDLRECQTSLHVPLCCSTFDMRVYGTQLTLGPDHAFLHHEKEYHWTCARSHIDVFALFPIPLYRLKPMFQCVKLHRDEGVYFIRYQQYLICMNFLDFDCKSNNLIKFSDSISILILFLLFFNFVIDCFHVCCACFLSWIPLTERADLAHVLDRWCQGRFPEVWGFPSLFVVILRCRSLRYLSLKSSRSEKALIAHLKPSLPTNVDLSFRSDHYPSKWCFGFLIVQFDSNLGYPGEGPTWTCYSANVDSLNSHPNIFQWKADMILAQETRISENVLQHLQNDAKENGKQIYPGALLVGKRDSKGHLRTPHGGCACIANPSTTRLFVESDDETGLWKTLHQTSRVAAVWHQILPKVRILCITFYGHSNIQEGENFKVNEHIISMIFTLCSQFGDIPIIFSGDFQADPDSYQSIVSAKNEGFWADPLTSCETDGSHARPITFSRSGNFHNPTDHFSSIDGLLVNRVSLAALKSIRVCYEGSKAHAPIEAVFDWPCILLKGPILVKTAPLDMTELPKNGDAPDFDALQKIALEIWQSKYEHRFDRVDDETAWKYVNQLGTETLTKAGARFQKGLKHRGKLPEFSTKTIFPGQDRCGAAATRESLKLSKAFNIVTELRKRFQRPANKQDDLFNTYNLQLKVTKTISGIKKLSWWKPDVHLHDDALSIVQKELHALIVEVRLKEKRQRISAWKDLMKKGTSSKNVSKFVYQWIQNKTKVNSPNLIKCPDGNIISDPKQALDEINSQWDSIFGANTLHEDPHDILKHIWPIVEKIRFPTTVPKLNGEMLRRQAMKRKIDAAPGIDGWRTSEIKMLPLQVFEVAAKFLADVEVNRRQLPKILCSVRQVILDKGGSDTPLQKRLISLLPIFMVTYTSLRFKQLANWQATVMPKNLFGGIKGRKISHLQTDLKLKLDCARTENQKIVGIKLDKSKCFDRLIPGISAAIMLSLGVPFPVVNIFAKLYNGLQRFLCYKDWTCPTPTTAANGVIQGCSLSLLAINCHMAIWACFLQKHEALSVAAYIDDCYLWTHLENIRILNEAMALTTSWDSLTGQLVHEGKSVAWANTTAGRKAMKFAFPNMKHAHNVEILGVVFQTTEKSDFGWDSRKTQKILRDIQLIKALPCNTSIHCHLIGAKIVPQINFSPHLGLIPKDELQQIQSAIVNLVWKNRPKWRSKWLVLGLLAPPFRVDPYLARSYQTIIECVSFLKERQESQRGLWQLQFHADTLTKHALISVFRDACDFLEMKMVHPFYIQFRNCEPINFLNFGIKEMRTFLKCIARSICYTRASHATRKDIYPATGVLDAQLSLIGHKSCSGILENNIKLTAYRDSSITGCTITNDRRFRAGFTGTNLCRFCNEKVETLSHVVLECTKLPCRDSQPIMPTDCGPNFPLLGIVEVPDQIVSERLYSTPTAHIPVADWNYRSCNSLTQVWTDGSCAFPEFFWMSKGGFSIINDKGFCIHSGTVHHPALSSYSTELWALIYAFCSHPNPIEVATDCDTIVQQTKQLVSTLKVPHNWQHYEWWVFFLSILRLRLPLVPEPIKVRWVPSHLLEHIPIHQISDAAARESGSCWLDIFCNRTADLHAKRAIHRNFTDETFSKEKVSQISIWQKWLAKVSSIISAQCYNDEPVIQNLQEQIEIHNDNQDELFPHQVTLEHDISTYKKFLPKWAWDNNIDEFSWCTDITTDFNQPKTYASISKTNWDIIVSFLLSCQWKICDEGLTSYMEITFAFWDAGMRLDEVSENPEAYSKCIRKCINQALKAFPNNPIVPGSQIAKCKSWGRTLPAGCLKGCILRIEHSALKRLAFTVLHGKSHLLSCWGTPF